jgi:indole-3-glycerol phosphate synthase
MSILNEIYAYKRQELEKHISSYALEDIRNAASGSPMPRDFIGALKNGRAPGYPALIAEVKHRSPSRGILLADFDPLLLARSYAANGAAAISVLTDEHFFGGSIQDLQQIAEIPENKPILRKDFIFHPYQVYESRLVGADAVLLIAAMLPASVLTELYNLASELGMGVLVEVHSKSEVFTALELKPGMLGINNRDLDTFEVNLETTLSLRSLVPPGVCLVSESGIHNYQDVQRLAAAGIDAILVGEALVTSPDLPAKVRELSGYRLPGMVHR